MKLRWLVDYKGDKILQYHDDKFDYWYAIDIEYECVPHIKYVKKLEKRLRELEYDYNELLKDTEK